MTKYLQLLSILILLSSQSSSAFITPTTTSSRQLHPSTSSLHQPSFNPNHNNNNSAIITPSRSNSNTQLHSLFGLGPAELAIIGVAAVFLIGPSKLSEFTRSAGELAGKEAEAWKDLKNIPEEFQKGVEEGEIESRSRKAKVMEKVDDE